MKVRDAYDKKNKRHVMDIIITFNELKKAGKSEKDFDNFMNRLRTAILEHEPQHNNMYELPEWRRF